MISQEIAAAHTPLTAKNRTQAGQVLAAMKRYFDRERLRTRAHDDETTALAFSRWSCQNGGMSSIRLMR